MKEHEGVYMEIDTRFYKVQVALRGTKKDMEVLEDHLKLMRIIKFYPYAKKWKVVFLGRNSY